MSKEKTEVTEIELSPREIKMNARIAEIDAMNLPFSAEITAAAEEFAALGPAASGHVSACNALKVYLPESVQDIESMNEDFDIGLKQFQVAIARRLLTYIAELNIKLSSTMLENSIRVYAETTDVGQQLAAMEDTGKTVNAHGACVRRIVTTAIELEDAIRVEAEAAATETAERTEEPAE